MGGAARYMYMYYRTNALYKSGKRTSHRRGGGGAALRTALPLSRATRLKYERERETSESGKFLGGFILGESRESRARHR